MAEVPPSPQTSVFVVDHKRRKVTPERAKANYLCGQLRLRLQYAKLKVEHGWQRQTLNEVENLYFRHTHKSRPIATPKQNGHRTAGTSSARYTPNMLFPVNDYHCEQDANSREQITGSSGRELVPGLIVENGSVAASSVLVPLSPLPAVPVSAWPIPSVEAHATPTVEPPQPQSVRNGPDSGTLEQAAASMFSPGASAPEPLSANGLAPDPKYPPMPNGNVPMHFQPTGVPYCGGDSVYPPAQVHFYPAHPYQYEFHYHTPPQATPFFTSPPHQDAPGLQAPVQIHSQPSALPQQSPQAQHRQSDSFNAAMSAQQSAPPNPTLTYDAFWSSHSQSAHSYRNVMYNPPGPTYQGQMNGVYLTANAGPGVADASGLPVSAPMMTAGLPEMAGAPAHATPSAHNF